MTGNKRSSNSNNSITTTQITFLCQVCNELARGYHFGAFTCEGCKSFFGRTCKPSKGVGGVENAGNKLPTLAKFKLHCKNGGKCDVQGRNRTSCKFCRFNKCIEVGMAPQNSRYGRRSKYFKVSSLIEAQKRTRSYAEHQVTGVGTSPVQFIKPALTPVWGFPVWFSSSTIRVEDSLVASNNYEGQQKLYTYVQSCPQTEPLDLSIKK